MYTKLKSYKSWEVLYHWHTLSVVSQDKWVYERRETREDVEHKDGPQERNRDFLREHEDLPRPVDLGRSSTLISSHSDPKTGHSRPGRDQVSKEPLGSPKSTLGLDKPDKQSRRRKTTRGLRFRTGRWQHSDVFRGEKSRNRSSRKETNKTRSRWRDQNPKTGYRLLPEVRVPRSNNRREKKTCPFRRNKTPEHHRKFVPKIYMLNGF